ncbi:MAG: response regulator [Rhodospirillaceae bacterium]|nr:response regulator [Rhodospirillaceae bacterium]MBL6930126.1 response regulator [Rhodospirillales bacterium]MBL6940888.1 response regulator [Rhodospirillales bacterium]
MAEPYLANVKFLVVEDNKFMQTVIRRVLNSLGTKEVRECTDGADALKVLKTFPADIVITDWAMEPLDGIELTRMIRTASDSNNPYVPIIMLTAYSEMIRIVEARDAGVNEFVVKPISVNTLFSRIQAVIEKPRTFIRIKNFFGPDRRRKDMPFNEPDRRKGRTTLPDNLGSDGPDLDQDEINTLMNPGKGEGEAS